MGLLQSAEHTRFSLLWQPFFWKHRYLMVMAVILIAAYLSATVSVWKIIALVFTAALFVITLIRPRWALLFLAVWMPFEPFLLKFVPDELYLYARYFSEGLIYILAFTVLIRLLARGKHGKQTPIDFPFVLFFAVLVISAIVNAVPASIAILGARQILRFVILFFVVIYLYPSQDFVRRLITVMLVVVAFQSLLGVAQAASGGALDAFLIPSERKFFESVQLTSGISQFWDPGSRIFGTLGRYDQLGTFLSFFLLLALGLLYERGLGVERRQSLMAVFALGLAALLLTYSRASWFGLLIGVLFIGIWLMRDRRVFIGLLLFLGLVLGYLTYSGIVVPKLIDDRGAQTVAERFFETFSYERWRSEYFGLGRLYWIVHTPFTVVRHAPLLGVGPGSFGGGAAAALGTTRAYDSLGLPFGVAGTEGYIDNNWFSLWGETGTLGLGLYLWMYVAVFLVARRVFRSSTDPFTRGLAAGLAGALLAVALQAFLGTYLEVRTLALYVWLIGGCVVVLGRREKLI